MVGKMARLGSAGVQALLAGNHLFLTLCKCGQMWNIILRISHLTFQKATTVVVLVL